MEPIVITLVNKGVDINIENVEGNRALSYTSRDGTIFDYLRLKWAELNFVNKEGQPLPHTLLQNWWKILE